MIQSTFFLGLPAHVRLQQIENIPQTLILSLAIETAKVVPLAIACLAQHAQLFLQSRAYLSSIGHFSYHFLNLPVAARCEHFKMLF